MRKGEESASNELKEQNREKEHRKSTINNKRKEEKDNGVIKSRSKIGDMKEKIVYQK